MPRLNSYRELEHLREQLREQRQNITTTVMVCGGTGCQASQSRAVIDAVRDELAKQGLEQNVRLCVTGCHGFCEQGPVMVIEPGNVFYCHVSPEDAFEIVYQTVMNGEVIDKDEDMTGQRREGMYAGVNSFITKYAMSVAQAAFLFIIVLFGYDASLAKGAQDTTTETGIIIAWVLLPGIALLLCAVVMKWYPLHGPEWIETKARLAEIHKQKEKEFLEKHGIKYVG